MEGRPGSVFFECISLLTRGLGVLAGRKMLPTRKDKKKRVYVGKSRAETQKQQTELARREPSNKKLWVEPAHSKQAFKAKRKRALFSSLPQSG